MEIKLLVLRTNDMQKLVNFYMLLGLTFDYHKHEDSPFHYSTLIEQMVLEIYPLAKNQTEPNKNLRLGFKVDNFEAIIEKIKKMGVPFLLEPTNTEFGFMSIIADPDGRKIELYKTTLLINI